MEIELDWGTSDEVISEPIFDSTQSIVNPIAAVSTSSNFKLYQIENDSMSFTGEFPMVNGMNPHDLMFHRQDQNLLMLDPSDRKRIFCLDMNRGSIV